MDRPTANSSSSGAEFYWKECTIGSEDNPGLIQYSAGIVTLFVTSTVEIIVGIPFNIWLICHILNKRSKDARILPADFFPFHLAVIQVTFFLYVPLATVNCYLWQSNTIMNATIFLDFLALIVKPLLLCLVCVERYIAVVRPLDYIRLKGPKFKWGCVAFVWCIYLLLTTWSLYSGKRYLVYTAYIPIFIIDTFCTRSILRSLRRPPPGDRNVVGKKEKRAPWTEGGEKEERGGDQAGMKKRAYVTVVIIQAMFTVNYTPFILLLMLGSVLPAHTVKCELVGMCLSAALSFSYMQPVLYLHRLGRLPCSKAHGSARK